MKTNSLKLLLNVLPTGDHTQHVSLDKLSSLVFPKMKSASFRSLLYLAKRNGWLDLQTVAGERVAVGYRQAREAISHQFPALSPEWVDWQGKWLCMVFREPPKTDRRFRYLRTWCRSHHCLPLSRGVYFAPDVYLAKYWSEIRPIYVNSVTLLETKEWQGDSLDRVAREEYSVAELSNEYSGVSNQIDRMLNLSHQQNKLDDGQIKQLPALFERLYMVLFQDLGVIRYYFPHLTAPMELVKQWQSLVEVVTLPNK